MSSFFLRRKIFSRPLLGNKEHFRLYFQFKFGCLGSASNKVHPYSSYNGAITNDFTDLTCPHTWYPQARRKRRKVVLHVGPTNSGKTHHALKQLESSASGKLLLHLLR